MGSLKSSGGRMRDRHTQMQALFKAARNGNVSHVEALITMQGKSIDPGCAVCA